jgi:hypothetical protein
VLIELIAANVVEHYITAAPPSEGARSKAERR